MGCRCLSTAAICDDPTRGIRAHILKHRPEITSFTLQHFAYYVAFPVSPVGAASAGGVAMVMQFDGPELTAPCTASTTYE